MSNSYESQLVKEAVDMRKRLTGSLYNIDGILRIFTKTPVSDYIKQDAPLGGYVPHRRKRRKKNFFV